LRAFPAICPGCRKIGASGSITARRGRASAARGEHQLAIATEH
jgi:hypothetical protein